MTDIDKLFSGLNTLSYPDTMIGIKGDIKGRAFFPEGSMKITILFPIFLWAFCVTRTQAQCTLPITHTSGTQQVGCTSVTVTSQNGTMTNSGCSGGTFQTGPYHIGLGVNSGSYTFTFSPSISSLEFDYRAVDNFPWGADEISININNSFYPITDVGTPIGCYPLGVIVGGKLRAVPQTFGAGNTVDIVENISTITITTEQIFGSSGGIIFGLRICCNTPCTTDAGSITAQGLTNYCTNETVDASHNGNQVLDGNDILRYVLFSNPSDTAGSIVAVSNTPSFSFAPPMQTGVTYYVAAVAGNNLNGNVDLTDPCLDFSNANALMWRLLPTVAFSASNPNVCAGACTAVTANFTGTAPFTLTYTTPTSGMVTQTFSGNSGTFQLCTAAGSPPGSLEVLATALVDSTCSCQ